MSDFNAGAIAQVILLAREMQESISVGAHDGIRDSRAGSQALREFRSFIANMSEEDQAALVAVMWIGRDSFGADDYAEAYATAVQERTNPTEDYLQGVPMLSDYLEAGLEALGVSPGDVEDGVI